MSERRIVTEYVLTLTTVMGNVDLDKATVEYIIKTKRIRTVATPSYITLLTSVYTTYTIVTAILRSYLLPDGSLYTVIRVPTQITVATATSASVETVTEEEGCCGQRLSLNSFLIGTAVAMGNARRTC